ncbi:CHASE2 domain-containing protein [Maribacter algicola]|uniref:CHASE2 domain-containing protein n=2 Tax=Maribacter algicola TaxID=2498892 RepID=A0A3R8R1I3_9FLAO|nr:CHASE2 domain-containing protein [Maribacter algicola]
MQESNKKRYFYNFFMRNRNLFKEAFLCMIFAFTVLCIVSWIGISLNFFSPFKNAFKDFSYLDMYYAEKLETNDPNINENIILVNVDRRNRKEIAGMLQKIQESQPKVIGVDVIFKDLEDPVWDRFLSEFLKSENIVAAYVLNDDKRIISNKNILEEGVALGYSNFNFDDESAVIRNFRGVYKKNDTILEAFGTAVSKKFMAQDWDIGMESYLSIDRPINYSGNRDFFLVLEYDEIMNGEFSPLIKDKIILVGYLGNPIQHRFDLEDKHFTPMNPRFVGKSPPDTFGLVIHANIVQMIIEGNFIKVVPNWIRILLTIVLTYMALCYFIWLNKRQLASYILRLNIVQLFFIVFFVWVALLLFRQKLLFKTASITAVMVFSIGLIGFYKKLAHYLYKRFKWEGFFFHD